MITAVDAAVLIDVFVDDPVHRDGSLAALRLSLATGPLIACDVVWAEVVASFPDPRDAHVALGEIPIAYAPMTDTAASRAGVAWRSYRRGGGPRDRLVADFLVGAHALEQADQLLTRDRGFHRLAFAGLTIVDPTRS